MRRNQNMADDKFDFNALLKQNLAEKKKYQQQQQQRQRPNGNAQTTPAAAPPKKAEPGPPQRTIQKPSAPQRSATAKNRRVKLILEDGDVREHLFDIPHPSEDEDWQDFVAARARRRTGGKKTIHRREPSRQERMAEPESDSEPEYDQRRQDSRGTPRTGNSALGTGNKWRRLFG